MWGDYPFFESAFVGGATTVRGLREQRYAGDAAVYGNAELRRPARPLLRACCRATTACSGSPMWAGSSSRASRPTPGTRGVGGGFWFAFLEPANTITVAVARGDDRTALYLRAGFAY